MSVRKLLIVTAGVVIMGATAAMAGGPDRMDRAMMPAQSAFQNSIYLDGHLGYGQSDWADNNANGLIGAAGSNYLPTSNAQGGVTGGLDLGYSVTRYIAMEAGWFYLPKVSAAGSGVINGGATIATTSTADVKSWLLYAAAKLSVSVMDNWDLFGKVGVGYRNLNYDGISNATLGALGSTGHYWLPLLAAGVEYTMDSWLCGAQYMYVTGNTNVNHANPTYGAPNAAPSASLYTAFLGYKFNM